MNTPLFRKSLMILSSLACVSVLWGQQGAQYRGGLVTPPLTKPKFILTDTSGAPFDFWKETHGYVTLLFFGYTYCPDQCPMHMANLGVALKNLPTGISDQVK